MASIFLVVIAIGIIIALTAFRYRKTFFQVNILMGDILMVFATGFATWSVLSYILSLPLVAPESFLTNIDFFAIFGLLPIIGSYLLYKKDIPEFNLLWLASEVFMSFGIVIVSICLIYSYLGIGHLPQEVMDANFHTEFLPKEDEDKVKMAGNLIGLFIGGALILVALVLNAIRVGDKKGNQ